MFTGIIGHVGTVIRRAAASGGARLAIELGRLAEELAAGDSVAVSGACLTVAVFSGGAAEFDVVAETLARTTLGSLRSGSKVNLETALRVGGKLDGHLVQGHVDGLAQVRSVRSGSRRGGRPGPAGIAFAAEKALTDMMVAKGSVAIDGVSLTLAGLADGRFEVALIPTTLCQTTLGQLRPGAKVNVETDIIGKYIRRCLEQAASQDGRLTLERLKESGFAQN